MTGPGTASPATRCIAWRSCPLADARGSLVHSNKQCSPARKQGDNSLPQLRRAIRTPRRLDRNRRTAEQTFLRSRRGQRRLTLHPISLLNHQKDDKRHDQKFHYRIQEQSILDGRRARFVRCIERCIMPAREIDEEILEVHLTVQYVD